MFKKFPLVDILEDFRKMKLKRTTQLFIISLIAYYHERARARGEFIDNNINQKSAIYSVNLTDKEIHQKFGFSIDTIINIKRELEIFPIEIEFIEVVSRSKRYKKFMNTEWHARNIWIGKYENREYMYSFKLETKHKNIINVPTRIIYEKKERLSYSEKLAIIWNLSLKEKLDRKPKIKEIQLLSGISGRTITKAKKKYPQLFI